MYVYICGHTGRCCTHCVHVLAMGLVDHGADISIAVLLITKFIQKYVITFETTKIHTKGQRYKMREGDLLIRMYI